MYVVLFIDCETEVVTEFPYEHLMDALRVAKETNIGDSNSYVPAIPNSQFDQHLINLLAGGYVYAGQKTTEFPEGKLMIGLLKGTDPVYDLNMLTKGLIAHVSRTKLPHQTTKEEVTH